MMIWGFGVSSLLFRMLGPGLSNMVYKVNDMSPAPAEFPGAPARFEIRKTGPPPSSKRGRPRKVNSQQWTEAFRLYFEERMSMRQVANVLGLSHMSVYRMLSDPDVEIIM